MDWHSQSVQEIERELNTGLQGLTQNEAVARLEQYGENKLRSGKKKTNLQRFLNQFKDVMILILLVAAAVSFVIACVEGEPNEFFEPVLILVIVILNAVMGVVQESKAEKALEALKDLSAPRAKSVGKDEKRWWKHPYWFQVISFCLKQATLSPLTPAC